MRRREFIALLGSGVAGGPLVARAQQAAMRVVGFLNSESPNLYAHLVRAFREFITLLGGAVAWRSRRRC